MAAVWHLWMRTIKKECRNIFASSITGNELSEIEGMHT